MSILWRLCGSLMRIIGELYGKMLIGGYDGGYMWKMKDPN
jgi:hypothetical protein